MAAKKPLTRRHYAVLCDALDGRDLVLFRFAVDSMLRSSDVCNLRVRDLVDSTGIPKEICEVKQKKTGKMVQYVLSLKTRQLLTDFIIGKSLDDYVFAGRKGRPLTTARHRQLVKIWAFKLGVDTINFSTHSLRKTKASAIYEETKNVEVVRRLLGQSSVAATSAYLGIDQDQALEIARQCSLA